jgi:hypothetical protein
METFDTRVPLGPGTHDGAVTERYVGRALGILWIFWVIEFWLGQLVSALAGQIVASLAELVAVGLAAYAIWHWEWISAWVMLVFGVVWPIAYPLVVAASGGDNIAAVTIVTFVLFALPALGAAGLILDGERRLKAK